ncbi:hypothetical protein BBK82_31760 [Lentzea guizhouensis]|uniref:asparagine synthase (glutamine-hydrolyzing) n=1 Tax=Lentzea guizhouensis TaxID=1586287 RepID=A0A1B2HQH0_9PSEU|nr:asparagine synthase-related protein [Lentzea guizhouensis]ANZ39941.1 hypothetical protein BBK82_31760 [Lentzea guizhouensis]
MCGITGWVGFGQDPTIRHDVLAAMTATLTPRGPASGGMWTSEHAALGHRGIGTATTQPMSAGHVTTTTDCEVLNFQELRADLRGRGHRFSTDTDTEVVLRGYLEWGLGVAERLNGTFAFALWDARAQRLVLVRDRLGVKPLHYCPTPNGAVFGSEPKAVLAHPDIARKIDADGLRELFTLVRTPGHACWAGLREVRPGTVLTVDRSGVREHVYWRLETEPHLDDADTTAKEVRRLLEDSLAHQFAPEVLPGGLGTSAITALTGARTCAPTTAEPDLVALREDVVRACDLPLGLGELTRLDLLRAVRQRVDVVLSGDGADELFGGYPWYHHPVVQQARTFPWLVGAGAPFLHRDVREWLDLDTYAVDACATAVREIARLPGEPDQAWRLRKMTYLHLTRFLRVLLDRTDRLAAAAGLRVRLPFADHRLVEYVYNAPQPFDGAERGLLHAAVSDRLPAWSEPPAEHGAVELPADHPVFDLVDRAWLATAADDPATRRAVEQVLDLAVWLEVHRPEIVR